LDSDLRLVIDHGLRLRFDLFCLFGLFDLNGLFDYLCLFLTPFFPFALWADLTHISS
jgi:hypothetical protein